MPEPVLAQAGELKSLAYYAISVIGILSGVIAYLFKLYKADRDKKDESNAKHIERLAAALERSNIVIESNTEAINANTEECKQCKQMREFIQNVQT